MGKVREALEDLYRAGMRAAFLCTKDGFVIDSVTSPNERIDLDYVVAGVTGALQSTRFAADQLMRTVRSFVVELEDGTALLVRPAGDDVVGGLLATNAAALNTIRTAMHDRMPVDSMNVPSGEPVELLAFINYALEAGSRMTHAIYPASVRGVEGLPAAQDGAPDAASKAGAIGTAISPISRARRETGGRLALVGLDLSVSGLVATATVHLAYGSQKRSGKVVAVYEEEQRRALVAKAAALAVTGFLPAGYAINVKSIKPTSPEAEGLLATVLFLSPGGEELLLGVATIDDDLRAAAKAVLSAVNRRVGLLV